jgi:hypothetical protein
LDAKTLTRKTVRKALKAPANLVSGAVALAASAAVWNPLPLILWGLGSAGWVLFAASNKKLAQQVIDEERVARFTAAEREREALRIKVERMLLEHPVQGWVRAGYLPDYIGVYRRLLEVRDRVARVMQDRGEVEYATQEGVLGQMGYMLTAFLQFVRERVVYLQILANVRPSGGPDTPPPPPPPASRRSVFRPEAAATPIPVVDQRLAEVEQKIVQLTELAKKEPATAKTRQWHIGILEKQRELLHECQKRDQCVVAQLGAFADVFEVILGRVSASQFSATEIASYMGSVVEQIEETERFVESLKPAMDELMGGMDPGVSRWRTAT